jgi:hypothetical protein
MSGNFQPARLDVDPGLLDSQLSFVQNNTEDEMDQLFFGQMNQQGAKIETLLPEDEYSSVTVYPKPGLCVKTKNDKGAKFFLNLCRVDEIPAPTPMKEEELARMIAEEDYSNLWRVPMSIGAPRKEKDKTGVECFAADVAINSDWFSSIMEPSLAFTAFVITVAIEGLGDKHSEEARLERDSWTILKNKKYLGDKVPPHCIQKRASLGIKPVTSNSSSDKSRSADNAATAPQPREPMYKIEKNRKINPTELKAEVYLPGVFSLNQIMLNLGEDRILLETKTGNFYLDVFLPVNLDNACSKAWFNNTTCVLHIKSPLI